MSNSKQNFYVIQIKYLGNPELLAGELTIAYLANTFPIPGTNYESCFVKQSVIGKVQLQPFMFTTKADALYKRNQLQAHLNEIQKIVNNAVRPGPHAKYLQFFVKVVPWDLEKFKSDIDEMQYLQNKKAVEKRLKDRQLYRSRMRDKPIVDDLYDIT